MNRHACGVSDDRSPVDDVLDLFFFAPLGAMVELWERQPEFAKRGREKLTSQAPAARMIGEFAVKTGRQRIEARVGDVADKGREALRAFGLMGVADEAPTEAPATADEAQAAPSASLPIEGYDELTAVKIVPLLAELTADERDTIRAHEVANRDRRTVLSKLDQLDARA